MKFISKETLPFDKALQVLKHGSRIRRKSTRKGYTKITTVEGKNREEKFGVYWINSENGISEYCSFSMDDVLATDWIVDK